MRTLIILFIHITLFSTEIEWINNHIKAIKQPKEKIEISNIRDPFTLYETKKEVIETSIIKKPEITNLLYSEQEIDFTLYAIINNSAMINKHWYKKDEKIGEYTIVKIDNSSVTLKREAKEILLSTSNKISTLKFKNK